MLAVLPPNHPLADAPYYPLKRFSEERIIKLTDEANNEVSKVFAQLNSMLDTPVTAYCDVNDDYSIMAMVESGLGVAVLSALAVEQEVQNGTLLAFEMDKSALKRTIYLITLKSQQLSRMEQKLVDFLKSPHRRKRAEAQN